eukprot:FR742748.1.p1 GENE.FR742748.1~~FR742748.1.p1  ORF type:complete len:284 (+),score=170.57 FR742748.1:257-1108(+)
MLAPKLEAKKKREAFGGGKRGVGIAKRPLPSVFKKVLEKPPHWAKGPPSAPPLSPPPPTKGKFPGIRQNPVSLGLCAPRPWTPPKKFAPPGVRKNLDKGIPPCPNPQTGISLVPKPRKSLPTENFPPKGFLTRCSGGGKNTNPPGGNLPRRKPPLGNSGGGPPPHKKKKPKTRWKFFQTPPPLGRGEGGPGKNFNKGEPETPPAPPFFPPPKKPWGPRQPFPSFGKKQKKPPPRFFFFEKKTHQKGPKKKNPTIISKKKGPPPPPAAGGGNPPPPFFFFPPPF